MLFKTDYNKSDHREMMAKGGGDGGWGEFVHCLVAIVEQHTFLELTQAN